MASGSPGVALGACSACGSPLVVSSRDAVSLPCPHCSEAVTGSGAECLVDQWTEPWTKVEGGGLELEYRLALVEAKSGLSAGCAVCGGPTPAGDASSTCPRCGSVTWVERGGERLQLGVRIDGVRDKRPFKVLVSIVQGESLLRADSMRGTSGRSGSSMLSATGLGCATAIAVVVLLVLGVWIAAHFAGGFFDDGFHSSDDDSSSSDRGFHSSDDGSSSSDDGLHSSDDAPSSSNRDSSSSDRGFHSSDRGSSSYKPRFPFV